MPLYEYQCRKCARRFEKIEKFSATPLTKCEVCGGFIERLISAPTFQFKGTGWYVTDYGSKSGPSEAGNGNGDKASPGATAASSDSKSSDSKSSETKTSESKSSESRTSEGKSSERKTSERKTASKR